MERQGEVPARRLLCGPPSGTHHLVIFCFTAVSSTTEGATITGVALPASAGVVGSLEAAIRG